MMVFWEWKVSLKLQINLYRIDIFTTLYFSTQEHGVCVCVCVCITPQFCVYIHTHTHHVLIHLSLRKCTYLHFRNFFSLPIGFADSLLNLCLNIFLSFGIINVVCYAVIFF